jgi:hypothetical protein
MVFHAVVAFDLQGAKAKDYSILDTDLGFFAQIFKRGSPANTFTGQIHAKDLATAQKTLRDGLKMAFDANDLHGTVRFWITETLYEDSFVA